MAAFAYDRMPTTGSKANLESDWSAKLNSYTDGIAMLHSCGKLVIWLSQSYDLIGAWKFLSAGPRILPKFTRPFSSSRVGSGDETSLVVVFSILLWLSIMQYIQFIICTFTFMADHMMYIYPKIMIQRKVITIYIKWYLFKSDDMTNIHRHDSGPSTTKNNTLSWNNDGQSHAW